MGTWVAGVVRDEIQRKGQESICRGTIRGIVML